MHARTRAIRFALCSLAFVCPLLLHAGEGPSPIVFAHGIGVPAMVYEHVVPLRRVFGELGYDLRVARTPVAGTLEERSQVLHDEIVRLVPEGPFHLVGHSMGGLDARMAVARYPDLAARCLSVTTLATPHHGAAIADWVVEHLDDLGENSEIAHKLLDLFGGALEPVRQLTTGFVENAFNGRVRDNPTTRYYSMGFYIPEPVERHTVVPLLWIAHSITRAAGGEHNDGFVSVDSALWGRSLGVVPADHWSETAPIPFVGGENYRQIAARVARNLHEEFAEQEGLAARPAAPFLLQAAGQ